MKVFRPSENPITGGYTSTHPGYDFAGRDLPDAVRAGMDGVIIERVDLYDSNWTNTGKLTTKDYGNYIKIRHTDGTFELHAHLRKGSSFVIGTTVKQGQIVARIGSTGNSTGPHIHSEYRDASNKNVAVEFFQGGGVSELDKIRKERDDNWNALQVKIKELDEMRAQRDENWNKYQQALKATDPRFKNACLRIQGIVNEL